MIKSAVGESADNRLKKARAHAALLDCAFTGLNRAEYETDFDQEKAMASMVEVLNDSAKKMKDVGDPVDKAYRFIGEP